MAGTINIKLDRPDDPGPGVLHSCGLGWRVTNPIHDEGGQLDMLAYQDDAPASDVDVGFLDHRLLRWTTQLERSSLDYHISTFRLR